MTQKRFLVVFCAVALLALQAAAQAPQFKPGFNLFSRQQDVQLGQQAAAQAERQLPIVHDAALDNYINQLGRRLARYSPAPDYPYTFKVVRDKSINAFALPGGPVYVNTGTIAATDNEAALAGVLAHEISHVALRHATSNASKAMLARMPLAILGGMVGSGSVLGQFAQMGLGFGVNSIFLKYSRDAERQADLSGAAIMYQAGYNPDEMARFFQKLETDERSRSIQFLSDHPNPGNRVQAVRQEEAQLGPPKQWISDNQAFEQAKAVAMRLNQQSVPQGQQQGYGHPATAQHTHPAYPSSSFQLFNGGAFQMQYPNNWKVYGQDTSAVTIAPPEGIVQSQNASGLAYGAMVSSFEPEREGGQVSLSQAVSQLLDELRQSNPGLRILSRQQSQLDSRPAISVTLMGRSPVRGESEMDWLVAAQRPDGLLWYAVFVAPERDFSSFRQVFERMLDSVRFQR